MPRSDPQRAEDAAAILPLAATVLLIPPVILIFAAPVLLAGIPLIVAYVFGVWAVIILGAFLVARRLKEAEAAPLDELPTDGGRR